MLLTDPVDAIVGENLEDLLGHLMGSVGRGRVGIDRNPDDNGTERTLLDVISVGDSEEVGGGVNGVAPLHSGVDQVVNEGADAPETSQQFKSKIQVNNNNTLGFAPL
jgi:hypothetical protein